MISSKNLLRLLGYAEIQYKYAIALNNYYTLHKQLPKLSYPYIFTWGQHCVTKKDLLISRKEEKDAVMFLSHSALYLMAVQVDSILDYIFGKQRFKDGDIQAVSWIIRLIRNSFSHNPFYPKWLIARECNNKEFKISKLNIKFNTKGLNNNPVKRSDYGGPLAVLKILWFVKGLIEQMNKPT